MYALLFFHINLMGSVYKQTSDQEIQKSPCWQVGNSSIMVNLLWLEYNNSSRFQILRQKLLNVIEMCIEPI